MLRVTSTLVVLVSACAPASFAVESAGTKTPNEVPTRAVSEVTPDASGSHTSKLAPPFGRSAGVRHVGEPSEPAVPAVLASADQN